MKLNYVHDVWAHLNKALGEKYLNSLLEQWKQTRVVYSDAFPQERQNMLHLANTSQHGQCNNNTVIVLDFRLVPINKAVIRSKQRPSSVQIFEISNRIVTSVFDLIQNEHNYSKFLNTYRHQFLTHLTEWRRFFTLATTPSNQRNQQTWSRLHRQCHLKTLNVV